MDAVSDKKTLGFVGLGVMGEPMCRRLAQKSGAGVLGYDISPDPFTRLGEFGVVAAASLGDVMRGADMVFVSLPSGQHLEAVCRGEDGLLAHARPGQTLIDLGTSPVHLTQHLAQDFGAKGVRYADAPVARTREAAEQGKLAIMVGADEALFAEIEPLLRCFATDVTRCGEVGAGQVVKILNNMVVVSTIVALSEAAAIARRFGVDTPGLFDTFSKGSADSFALRNHGIKYVAKDTFPTRIFSTEYMLKDIRYAADMAQLESIDAQALDYARRLLEQGVADGHGAQYWPVISTLIGPNLPAIKATEG